MDGKEEEKKPGDETCLGKIQTETDIPEVQGRFLPTLRLEGGGKRSKKAHQVVWGLTNAINTPLGSFPPTQPPPREVQKRIASACNFLTSCSTATQYAVSSSNQQKSEKRKRVRSTSFCSGVTIISTMSSTVHTPSPSESSSPYATAASAKDNASRLRENQRRSRARKKEYLTSLEARVQACQRAGVEANVEIQNAAKRVVRENMLLREILRNRGVGDDEIDRIIREGGEGGVNGESAVEGVMKVLGRRPCGGEPLLMEKLGGERFIDRRNSTGMLGARDAGDRVPRGSETPCLPATGSGTCASAKVREQRTERRGRGDLSTFPF